MSNYDRFLEHQKLIVGNKKKKEKKPDKKIMKIKKEKINRHRTSEEYHVCIELYLAFTYILHLFYKNRFTFRKEIFQKENGINQSLGRKN